MLRPVGLSCLWGLALSCGNLLADDWPQFLGPGGNPFVEKSELPTAFKAAETDGKSGLNIAWRTPLEGRSVSGPIVVGNRVYTASSSSMEERWLEVNCVDAETGELLWQRMTKATGRPFCHPTSANAAPTPCSDGQYVCAFFSSNDVACYDLDGNMQWFRSMTDAHPKAGNDVGMSASPVTVDGLVIVAYEGQADSYASAIDIETGETAWEVERPTESNWSSPRIAKLANGQSVVILQAGNGVVGLEPKTGKQLWKLDVNCSRVTSSAFVDGKLFVPARGLKVFEMAGPEQSPKELWSSTRINPNSASYVVTKTGVLGVNRSVFVCCDLAGKLKWQVRLPDAGQIWATPVVAGDKAYVFAMNGKCFVVQLGDKGKLLNESELGESVLGSPAISGDAMYVRSTDSLWKISKSN